MKRAVKILAAGCFFALAAAPVTGYASVSWETDFSVAGAAVALNNYYASSLKPEEQLALAISGSMTEEEPVQTSPKAEVPMVTSTQSAYSNVAISHVSNYVNIRTEPNTDSEIVGKIYNNCAATILATVDGEDGKWYQIQSGTVKGYIKAEYFITGSEAEKIAKKVGTMYAKVANTTTLRLREEPNTTSTTLTLLSMDAEYVALEETGDFVKIQVDADLFGYVHKDYVNIRVEFKQAVSLEEERQQQEESDRLKQEATDAIAKLEQAKKDAAAQEAAAGTSAAATETAATASRQETVSQTSEQETSAAMSTEEIGTIPASPLESSKAAQSTDAPQSAAAQTTKAAETTAKQTTAAETTAKRTTAAETTAKHTAVAGGNGPGGGSGGPGGGSSENGPGYAAVTSATRTAIVAYAKQFLGNPYVYGGTSLTNGADCSGFTMRIYEHFGIDTGRTSRDQAAKGRTISLDEIQPGDLLFYASGDYINHVALYIGGGQVIHASSSTTGIIISPAYYRTPYKAVTFLD